MFYWCSLRFSDDGKISRYSIQSFQTEQELVCYFARLTYSHIWHSEYISPVKNYESGLKRLEKTQNITGRDGAFVYLRETYDPVNSVYHYTSDFFLKDKQLISVENGRVRVLDIRNWHEEILEAYRRGAEPLPTFKRKWKRRQGRTHKQWDGYHRQAGIVQTLRHISDGSVRPKRASKFKCAIDYDPKRHKAENNWKQSSKCRHQWEWHKKKHQDRMYLPEEDTGWECDGAWETLQEEVA